MGIIGFNSPEWFFSDLGCVFAGGLAAGIYPTNSADACKYVLANCKANIVVVEDEKQLTKILQVWTWTFGLILNLSAVKKNNVSFCYITHYSKCINYFLTKWYTKVRDY